MTTATAPPGTRTPPHSVEAEKSVLGAMLLSTDAISRAVEILGGVADDGESPFYTGAHRRIYRAILDLWDQHNPVDVVMLTEHLRRRREIDAVGGESYVAGLFEFVATAAHIEHHARVVRDRALVRRLIDAGADITRLAFDGTSDADTLLDQAESKLFQISRDRLKRGSRSLSELVHDTLAYIEKLANKEAHYTGVPSGYPDLDRVTSGFRRGNLIVVAGRPGMGKTTFALNIAEHVAVQEKKPVAIFSLEMSMEELAVRMLCSRARVDSQKAHTGDFLTRDDWQKLVRAASALFDARVFIDDSSALTVLELRAKARRLKADHDIGLIIVDYLQMMHGSANAESRQQEVAEISLGLKSLAKEIDVPVVALSQLSRAVEKRESARPMLSDLRECVTGDTLVAMADGRRVPIQDLVGKTPIVWSMSLEGRLQAAVSDRVWKVGRRPVLEVRLASGRTIRCTSEHRLLGATGWKRVRELEVGDRLAITRRIAEPAQPEEWPDLRVALLGQLIGDGSYLNNAPMRYTTASEENSRMVTEASEKEFGAKVTRYAGRGKWHQLLISGNGNRWHPRGVNAWLRELEIFGQRSHNKRIPAQAFRLSNAKIALLLQHLWATDGSITIRNPGKKGKLGSIYFSTCSRGLAEDVAALLLRIGVVARLKAIAQGEYRPLQCVYVYGAEHQRRFLDVVGGFGPRRDSARYLRALLADVRANTNVDTLPVEVFGEVRLAMAERGVTHRAMAAMRGTAYGGSAHFRFAPSRSMLAEYATLLKNPSLLDRATSDLFWDRVSEIVPVGEEDVFDLTVPGPSCWVADAVVSHNSGGLEQDSDLVVFLYKPETAATAEAMERPTAFRVRCEVAKHRNGPTGFADLTFITPYARFESSTQMTE